MRKTTLEKYFFNSQYPGLDLLKLTFVDIMATVPHNGKPDFSDMRQLERQIKPLARIARRGNTLPPELLNGNEIMKLTKLPPSPMVGTLKAHLREAQLKGKLKTKKQALRYLGTYARIHHTNTKRRKPAR
jgi:hypothetical protein